MHLNEHLHNTWISFSRKQRREVATPLVPFEFLYIEGEIVQYDKEKFYDFSRIAGATINHELEMLGEPLLLDGLEYTKRWRKGYGGYLMQLGLHFDSSKGLLYYPLSQLVWTSHRKLLRRRSKPVLTSYGTKRLQDARHKHILAWGELKSAYAWSRDDRAMVSDKTITARIIDGWKPEEAIGTPRK